MLVKEGYQLEFVDRNGGVNIAKEPAMQSERENEPRMLPSPPEFSKQKIYMISGGEDKCTSNQERKATLPQV